MNRLSRRDGLLILIGASCLYTFSAIVDYAVPRSFPAVHLGDPPLHPVGTTPHVLDLGLQRYPPETSLIAHAPGWTLFRHLYMSNGTFFILSSDSQSFPEIRMMISTSLPAENTPENIAQREPTSQEMQFITQDEAQRRWGGNITHGERNRILTVQGNTVRDFITLSFKFDSKHLVSCQRAEAISRSLLPLCC
jgi:hypothetical protein